MALDFTGSVVLVTGGSRGIGAGIAEGFLGAGAEVVVCSRHAPDVLPASGGRSAEFVEADVRDAESVSRLVDTVVERRGGLHVVVNNAGGSPSADASTASPRFSAAIIALNLTAPLLVAQAANAVMQAAGGGCVVNVGSVSGLRPSPGTAAYGAAKAGLMNLTRTLAVEWAPKVRVNCVSPGLIRTEMAEEHYGGPEHAARVAATVPLGRLGLPADVAHACLFLASPLAAYVSGANLVVDGGGERPAFLDAARP
ncbi:MAG: SDR family oxidoreductase [Acidimicrobiia bacterium]|nr:SDR family oxidoreductase [Acidimicrobiia bacterium]